MHPYIYLISVRKVLGSNQKKAILSAPAVNHFKNSNHKRINSKKTKEMQYR